MHFHIRLYFYYIVYTCPLYNWYQRFDDNLRYAEARRGHRYFKVYKEANLQGNCE